MVYNIAKLREICSFLADLTSEEYEEVLCEIEKRRQNSHIKVGAILKESSGGGYFFIEEVDWELETVRGIHLHIAVKLDSMELVTSSFERSIEYLGRNMVSSTLKEVENTLADKKAFGKLAFLFSLNLKEV
jgi:hypothetical protein